MKGPPKSQSPRRAAKAWASLFSNSARLSSIGRSKKFIPHVQPAPFIRLQLIDIAVFENAAGKR
jgi:hypothetical protein